MAQTLYDKFRRQAVARTDAGNGAALIYIAMCLAMNADRLQPGERCASTSNRNFEGRQGQGGRTHLVSPVVAAVAAIAGKFAAADAANNADDMRAA